MPILPGNKSRQNRRHRVEYAFNIDLYHAHPIFRFQGGHVAAGHDACIGKSASALPNSVSASCTSFLISSKLVTSDCK